MDIITKGPHLLANQVTRRQMLAGVAVALGALGLGNAPAALAQAPEEVSHSAESIHMEPVFKASRKRVYDALTEAKQFQKITMLSEAVSSGAVHGTKPAEFKAEPGGAFSLFDGFIIGRNLELIPNERLIQAWRVAYWPEGAWSITKFVLVEQGPDTKLVFDHTAFPKGDADHLLGGWKGNYFEPMAKFLAQP